MADPERFLQTQIEAKVLFPDGSIQLIRFSKDVNEAVLNPDPKERLNQRGKTTYGVNRFAELNMKQRIHYKVDCLAVDIRKCNTSTQDWSWRLL